ncbi:MULTISPECIES: flippase-like domain-containing protein [unclassified Methanoregula]|uniref:flippase-like domain-containing protein n=1 Tax=unclassified Methanoregula TaxID=2649730 RepID=UPI0009D01EBF|nr:MULTISPECIES: flippase-like domain-containing protein [unclassified Methanoregula]OPX65123.1 MAG: bifunctional 3-demethylubiquinone-9 3-methyltransferase/ 2-octaprenyl-6-hydroxy phenol methylase [Methanoregula sp. PtaB.Bin085]OPY32035.1 MAG: bifunctional 3-demethylubiquinone-9 3-methyltransferase/ 2-octaprenyl-6-hydroxy phenol methylase [Methanoregula sp. PtaU1.Bin006]
MKKNTVLKIFFTVVLIGFIFSRISILEVVKTLSSLNLVYLAGAFLFVPALIIIRTLRWNLFLNYCRIIIPFSESIKILLIGSFYGLVTPGHFGEIGRVFHIEERKTTTLPTIILEKGIDICTLIVLSALSILVFFPGNIGLGILIAFFFVAVTVVFFLMTNKKTIGLLAKYAGISQDDCEQFTHAIQSMVGNIPLMTTSFILALLYYAVACLIGYLVAVSAGFNPWVFVTIPLIVLIGNIPLTIAGLGLRESVGSLTFSILGENSADGFVFAFVLFMIITVFPSLVGYILVMLAKEESERRNGQITGLLSPYLEKRRIFQIRNAITGGRILDYGCGNGKLVSHIPFSRYTGTDKDFSAILNARKIHFSENVSFCSLEEFKGNHEQYDIIILSAVIEHFQDPFETLGELVTRLDNPGKIVITTPTPLGNAVLRIGSFIGIFSSSAFKEHNMIFHKQDIFRLAQNLHLSVVGYETFEFGLNQLAVLSNERGI